MTTLVHDKHHGVYRINSYDFPVPVTSWAEQPIASGLNAIPIEAGYRTLTWQWSQLEATYAARLYELYNTQRSSNTQLSSLETDPYEADLADESYGTKEYTDFIIVSVGERTRGMPTYDDVTVQFEVYVS